MLEETIITLISNVGFPIAITLWFMFRTEKVIKDNTDTMLKVSLLLEKEYFKEK